MAINLRSPYYISNNDEDLHYAILDLYIWTGQLSDKPYAAQYTLRKGVSNFTVTFEISELIRDYLDVTFGNDYISQCVHVNYIVGYYNILNNLIFPKTDETLYAFDSYSYFEESDFDVEDNSVMISNRKIFALEDNLVRIPINVKEIPTVSFFKDGKKLSTQSYFESVRTDEQIKYVTVNGIDNYDNYKGRVLESGGTFEDSKCLKAFLDEFEIGEVDKIIVSNELGKIETIDVEVLSECKYEPKKITFVNKFGALQDMYFFKKFVEKMNIKKESYKSNIIDVNSYNRSNHVNRDFNVVGKESVTLSSGFLSEEYNEVFKQLMLSEKVWITELTDTDELVLPINVKTSNITYKTSVNDKLVEYTIEFDRSYDVINNIR